MKLKENTAFWNERAKVFDEQVTITYGEAYKRTVEGALRYIKKEDNVLDIGCGTGIVTLPMAERAASVTGLDTSDRMLELARQKAETSQSGNIRFIAGDMYHEELKGALYDAITIFNVLLYIKERKQALKHIYSLLKPGGYFISATDCLKFSESKVAKEKRLKSAAGDMPYVAFFTSEELREEICAAGFLVVEEGIFFRDPINYFLVARRNESD